MLSQSLLGNTGFGFPTEAEVEQSLARAVSRYALSKQDRSCLKTIVPVLTKTGPGTFSLQCNQDAEKFLEVPPRFPIYWAYPRSIVPVSADLLAETPLRVAIPVTTATDVKDKDFVELDRRHFWDALVSTMAQTGGEWPQKSDVRLPHLRTTWILDVGCGQGWDAAPLQSFFGHRSYGIQGVNAEYLGIDYQQTEIESARGVHKDRPDLQFKIADATKLNDYDFTEGKFDVVVIRHPAVFERDGFRHIHPMWYKIFKESFNHLADGGIVIVTAYNCWEHQGARDAMKCLGARELFAGKNPYSAKITLYGKKHDWRDAYVSVYTR